MNTSKKHRNFVGEGMGNKPVRDMPGIGPVLARNLERRGYHMAIQVHGKFLESRNDQEFSTWLSGESKGNAKHVRDCLQAVKEYREHYP